MLPDDEHLQREVLMHGFGGIRSATGIPVVANDTKRSRIGIHGDGASMGCPKKCSDSNIQHH